MIAREGYPVIGVAWLVTVVSVIAVMAAPLALSVRSGTAVGILVLLGCFPLYFFRDPPRAVPSDSHALLLAPADGKVVALSLEEEPQYLRGPARRISIYLSLFSVHVNRIPADGILEYDDYRRGTWHLAWKDKASGLNEHSLLGIHHPLGQRILLKQIAGGLARRIVYHVGTGDRVKAGDRFGMIRFGSRLDVLVPIEIAVRVQVGDRVRAGETVIASLQLV